MNRFIGSLNDWSDYALQFGWRMLWQSSLLIVLVFTIDLLLRRKIRAVVRYVLWMAVLVKLVIPPSFALPTGLAWWLRPTVQPPITRKTAFVVASLPMIQVTAPAIVSETMPPLDPLPPAHLSLSAWLLITSVVTSLALLVWMFSRWRKVILEVRGSQAASQFLNELLAQVRLEANVRRTVRLVVTERQMSPALCGLFRPVILLPKSLATHLPTHQLRAVLLHELMHLRRGDVWVNLIQTLLQITYWWHPLLWIANAQIRRTREECVDDAVMLTLRNDIETYPLTLLEVAKMSFQQRFPSLGLVGILESKHALRQRIERLVILPRPRKAGLTFLSILGVLGFSAFAVPMGEAPLKKVEPKTSNRLAVKEDAKLLTETQLSVEPNKPLMTEDSPRIEFPSGEPTVFVDPSQSAAPSSFVLPNREEVAGDLLPLSNVATDETKASGTKSVVKDAEKPSGTPAAIVGSSLKKEPLYVRTFKVDPNTFRKGLNDTVKLRGVMISTNSIQIALGEFFLSLGVDLAPPKSMYYKDVEGLLLVRATAQELDIIEQGISLLNISPPQVNIKVKFLEIGENAAKHLLDWLPLNAAATLGTNPVSPRIQFPGPKGEPSMPATNSPTNSLVLSITSILSEPRFRLLIRALEQRDSVDLLGESSVTTLSGRQTEIQHVDLITVVTKPDWNPVITSNTASYKAEQLPFGPTLDVTPYVEADGRTIRMELCGTVTDFLGYDDPADLRPADHLNVPGSQLPLPHFRVRQVTSTARVMDGQTLVLGGFLNTSVHNGKPGPSHRPNSSSKPVLKNLLIFVTPTLIDPAGNRLHSEDELARKPGR